MHGPRYEGAECCELVGNRSLTTYQAVTFDKEAEAEAEAEEK